MKYELDIAEALSYLGLTDQDLYDYIAEGTMAPTT